MNNIHKNPKPSLRRGRGRAAGAIALLRPALILTLFLTVFPGLEVTVWAEPTFTVNTADQPPYSTPKDDGIYDLLIKAAFDRLNIKPRINHLPSARSLENVNLGWDDGEYARIAGLEHRYPNLVMVKEKLIDFAFTAFSLNPAVHLNGWPDLAGHDVAYMRGWKIYERRALKAKSAVVVSDEKELFGMLRQGRVDLALYELYRGRAYLEKHGLTKIYDLKKPLAVKGMYMYVHKKHTDLIPKIEQALRALKDDGEFRSIVKAALAR